MTNELDVPILHSKRMKIPGKFTKKRPRMSPDLTCYNFFMKLKEEKDVIYDTLNTS